MRRGCLVVFFLLVAAVVSLAEDQEKAIKQLRMITAMSRDETARSIVSRTFADVFKLERPQLIAERKSMGLNYGTLFLVHELTLSGSNMAQVATQFRQHNNMFEIANASGADWKRIAADAKKMNGRISDNIYKHFLHQKPDKERDLLDHYNPAADLVRADVDCTPEEIQRAQTEYIFRRNLAAPRTDGAANPSTPLGKSYQQTRENIAITHGDTPTR